MTDPRSDAVMIALVMSGKFEHEYLVNVGKLAMDIIAALDAATTKYEVRPGAPFHPVESEDVARQAARADAFSDQAVRLAQELADVRADRDRFIVELAKAQHALENANPFRAVQSEEFAALHGMLKAVHKALLGAFGATRVSDIQLRQADALYLTTNMRPFMEALGGEWADFLNAIDIHTEAMRVAKPRAAGEAKPIIVDPKATAKEGGE